MLLKKRSKAPSSSGSIIKTILQNAGSNFDLGAIRKRIAKSGRHIKCLNQPIKNSSLSFTKILVKAAVVATKKAQDKDRINHILRKVSPSFF